MKNQNTQRLQSVLLATIAIIFLLGAFNSTFAQNGAGARFGARDPRICADTKSPTKGAISAALATKYIICNREHVQSRDYLLLVEDVTVQVGGGVPFDAKTFQYTQDIDTKALVYPVRASLKSYTCSAVSEITNDRGKNCTINNEPNAKGICYKTTFGDWNCNAISVGQTDAEYNMPPPGGGAVVTSDKNKPTDTKKADKQTTETKADADENKDENGFPKPDFSEMEKWFEVVKYEYDPLNRKLNLVVKSKKETRPTATWRINFYDADGVAVIDENYVLGMSFNTPVGQPEKAYAYTPTESQMKRVKKVVITRIIE